MFFLSSLIKIVKMGIPTSSAAVNSQSRRQVNLISKVTSKDHIIENINYAPDGALVGDLM